MDPLTLAALLSAAGGVYRLGQGVHQQHLANKFGRAPRPAYQIPQAITDNVNLAKGAYGEASQFGLPGQARLESKLGQSSANAIGALQQTQDSPAAMAAAIASTDYNTKNAMADLGVKAAQYRAGQMNTTRGQLMNANINLGKQQLAQWDWDHKQKYLNSMAAASAYRNAAMRNINSGIDSLSNIASNYAIRGGFNKAPSTQAPTNMGQDTPPWGGEQDYPPVTNDPYAPQYG